jgi:hypothetical protein
VSARHEEHKVQRNRPGNRRQAVNPDLESPCRTIQPRSRSLNRCDGLIFGRCQQPKVAAACELSIHDEGIGFDPVNCAAGYGTTGMEEHARALGGTLSIASTLDKGTVRLQLPLVQPASDQ